MSDETADDRTDVTPDRRTGHGAPVATRVRRVSLPPSRERLGVTCSSVGLESAGYRLARSAEDPPQRGRQVSRFGGAGEVTQDWFLAYMITGSATLELEEGTRQEIRLGSVISLPPGSWYRLLIDGDLPYCIYYVTFGGQSMIERMVCTAIDELSPTAEIDLCGDVIGMYRQLLEIGASRTVDAQRELGASIVLLVAKLVNRLHERRQTAVRETPVARARAIMSAHLFDQISVAEIAREVGMPASTLRRVFRTEEGQSPYRYFLGRKIEAAKDDLRAEGVPLRAIAEKYSFADQYHFSRVFSRIAGCRPTEWRRKNRETDL